MKILKCAPWSDTRVCFVCETVVLIDEGDLRPMQRAYSCRLGDCVFMAKCIVCGTPFELHIPIGKERDGRTPIDGSFRATGDLTSSESAV